MPGIINTRIASKGIDALIFITQTAEEVAKTQLGAQASSLLRNLPNARKQAGTPALPG